MELSWASLSMAGCSCVLSDGESREMSVHTPAEMRVGVRECVARMCVSVSSRGQAGSSVGRGIDSL